MADNTYFEEINRNIAENSKNINPISIDGIFFGDRTTLDRLAEQIKHPLDLYRIILQQYDWKSEITPKHPNGIPVAVYRITETRVLDENRNKLSEEQNTNLLRKISFAKSWYKAIYDSLYPEGKTEMFGEQNEYGYNRKAWEFAFNSAGIRQVYDAMINTLANNLDSKLTMNSFSDMVSDESKFQYAKKICNNLFMIDKPENEKNMFLMTNTLRTLLDQAGVVMATNLQNQEESSSEELAD